MQHMNPRKIARFFKMLAEDGKDGAGRAMAMYNYVVTVEAKYLQMMCVNHTHKQDIEAAPHPSALCQFRQKLPP